MRPFICGLCAAECEFVQLFPVLTARFLPSPCYLQSIPCHFVFTATWAAAAKRDVEGWTRNVEGWFTEIRQISAGSQR